MFCILINNQALKYRLVFVKYFKTLGKIRFNTNRKSIKVNNVIQSLDYVQEAQPVSKKDVPNNKMVNSDHCR